MTSLIWIALFYTLQIIKAQDDDCTFTPVDSNITFNLNGLREMGRLKTTDTSNPALTYYFSVCRNLTGATCTEIYPGIGCAQQWTDNTCTYWLGTWAGYPDVILVNESNPREGFSVQFENGEECYSEREKTFPYKIEYVFLCDSSTKFKAEPAALNPYDKCLYEITIKTEYACAGNVPSDGSSNDSFSMGYVAIICFFSAIFLGLILYYVVLGIKSKNWGIQSMAPPCNLCKYFWIYTWVGCRVSFEWAREKSKKKGNNDLNKDFVDTDD